jgi:hypothetical protein
MEAKIKIKIPLENILNFDDYLDFKNLLLCNQCTMLAIEPYYCENCKVCFCSGCLEDLSIDKTKCPACALDSATLSFYNREKFNEVFKNLKIKCETCKENVHYPNVTSHECFKRPHTLENHEPKFILIDNVIHIKCEKCQKYINNFEFDLHKANNCYTRFTNPLIQIPQVQQVQQVTPSNTNTTCCDYCKTQFTGELINHLSQCPEILKRIPTSSPKDNLEKLMKNCTLTSNLDNTTSQLLISSIISLEKTIMNFEKNVSASYCKSCQIVKQTYKLIKCSCCEDFFCTNCCIPCLSCNQIISKTCIFKCQGCLTEKCPLCKVEKSATCACLTNKVCKDCYNMNTGNLTIGLLKGPHVSCNFFKLLETNVYVLKFPKFNFKSEININSIKQAISLNLIKNKLEQFSRIFQINFNDKLTISNKDGIFNISSNIDTWSLNSKTIEEGFDYLIVNFSTNPNYQNVLNKLNNINFDTLVGAPTMISTFNPKLLISSIKLIKI